MILLIIVLILVFGCGGGWYGYNNGWGPPNRPPGQGPWIGPGPWGGGIPLIILILILFLLFGGR
jgi:hypothetical protein